MRPKGLIRFSRVAIRPNGVFGLFFVACLIGLLVLPPVSRAQVDQAQRASLQVQLETLEREAAALDQQIAETQAEGRTLEREIKVFNDEIKRRELGIKRLNLAIRQAEIDIRAKTASIAELARRIEKNRGILAKNVQQLYEYDQENMLVVLAKHRTLSEFFIALDNVRDLQAQVDALVGELRDAKRESEAEKADHATLQ